MGSGSSHRTQLIRMGRTAVTLVAHDLKNALSSLEDELALLRDAPNAERVALAHQHCADLRTRFVQFLIAYGVEGPLRPLYDDESPLDLLQALARDNSARLAIQTAPISVKVIAEAAPAFWYFDRRLTYMALSAAMHNACRFASHLVTLSASERDGFLVLTVDDDGPGLDAQDVCKTSTGLGTGLCEAVATAHRSGERFGRIALFNRPGGGARFELWLP